MEGLEKVELKSKGQITPCICSGSDNCSHFIEENNEVLVAGFVLKVVSLLTFLESALRLSKQLSFGLRQRPKIINFYETNLVVIHFHKSIFIFYIKIYMKVNSSQKNTVKEKRITQIMSFSLS